MSTPENFPPPAAPTPPVAPPVATPTAPPSPYAQHGYAPTPPRPRGSAAGLVALIGAGALTFLYLVVKLVAAVLNSDQTVFENGSPSYGITMMFGVLGILAIIPAALVVVFGHLGIRKRPDGADTGRIVAAIGLGAGYVHVVAWVTRLIVATVLSAQYGDFSGFLTNIFWWA